MITVKHKGIFVFSAVIVVMFCVLGWFARPHFGDDFLFYNKVADEGFIQASIFHYTQTNGRIANHLFMDVFSLFGPERIYPFMASITAIVYILASFSLIGTLIPALTLGAKLLLSFLVCALTLCFTYTLPETFYWFAGMPYFWSCSLIMLALSLAVKASRGSRLSFVLCILVLFLNGTNLEQSCVFQGIMMFMLMLFFMYRGEKRRALMAGTFWLVSITAFCVMYFAPGTVARSNLILLPGSMSSIQKILGGFIPALSLGVLNAIQFFAKPLLYVVIFFMPAIVDKIPPADGKLSRHLRVWHIVAVMFVIGMFMQYMMGVISGGVSGLPNRGISINMWMMYLTWNVLWIFFYRGSFIRSEGVRNSCAKWRWPVLILSVIVSANFIDCVKALRVAPEYAAEYDARAELLREQVRNGVSDLIAPRLKTRPALIFSDIGVIDNDGNNARYYGYYGEKTLHAIPSELLGDDDVIRKLVSGDIEPLAKLAESNKDIDLSYMLALYYDTKFYTEHADGKESEKWYRLGSENGDTRCMKPLARVLRQQKFGEAMYWLLRWFVGTIRL